jgi:hypothetical protein
MMKCFIVMGLHSSGTSRMAEGLHLAGVQMWLRKRNDNFEDVEIKRINDWILKQAGGD